MGSLTAPLVLLTGPNGFVGAHVLNCLLTGGYRVRGTVRSLSKAKYFGTKYAASDLTFAVVPDIQAPNALDEAMEGVDYVCHVASPYFVNTQDPVKELIEPAVNGTKNVMASALKAKNLKKLTIMSSFASVLDSEKNPRAGYTYTDADWDPVTMEQGKEDGFRGYLASKTFAERAAWQMWREAKPSWDLITFCPPMIYGPPIHEVDKSKGIAGLNTSIKRLVESITGTDPAFAPKVATPSLPAWVDVRDVADAHLKALKLPEGTSERFLLCGGVDYFEDGLTDLRKQSKKGLGEEGAHCDPSKHYALDCSKAEKMLQLKFMPFKKTVTDAWTSMEQLGFV